MKRSEPLVIKNPSKKLLDFLRAMLKRKEEAIERMNKMREDKTNIV